MLSTIKRTLLQPNPPFILSPPSFRHLEACCPKPKFCQRRAGQIPFRIPMCWYYIRWLRIDQSNFILGSQSMNKASLVNESDLINFFTRPILSNKSKQLLHG